MGINGKFKLTKGAKLIGSTYEFYINKKRLH
jgi:hypothetical protein